MVSNNSLNEILQKPELLEEMDLTELQALQQRYPSVNSLYLLHKLKQGLTLLSDPHQLEQDVVYIHDRERLHNLLHQKSAWQAARPVPAESFDVSNTKLADKKAETAEEAIELDFDSSPNEAALEQEVAQQTSEVRFEFDFSGEAVPDEIPEASIAAQIEQKEAVSEESETEPQQAETGTQTEAEDSEPPSAEAPTPTKPEAAESPENKATEPEDFFAWLSASKAIDPNPGDHRIRPKKQLKQSVESAPASPSQKQTPAPESSEGQSSEGKALPESFQFGDAIERFLESQKKKRRKTNNPKAEADQLAEQSISMNPGILTESYVRILEKQGKIAKAIEALEQMRFLYPEKSDSFGSQIQKLKQKL
jgi:hypothetical protein